MTGVYFLFFKKKLVYIGATKCWPSRLTGHKAVKFDTAKILECPKELLLEYEKRLIEIFNPKSNVRNTTRARVRKMNLDWVKQNSDQIAPFMGELKGAKKIQKAREKAMPLLVRMKDELKYSPRTNPMDLFWSLRTAYRKINTLE